MQFQLIVINYFEIMNFCVRRMGLKSLLIMSIVIIISFSTWMFELLANSSSYENETLFLKDVADKKEILKSKSKSKLDSFYTVDCDKLFLGNRKEQNKAETLSSKHIEVLNNTFEQLKHLRDCNTFKSTSGYIQQEVNDEELEFPIAFSVMFHKDVIQFEKLLRTIYRPQNYYCVHVDTKTKKEDFETVVKLCDCFHNVFLSSERKNVQWGKFSELEADLVCLRDLLNKSKKWKYLLNVAAQEFPLKTNWELVKIFKLFNGRNSVEGVYRLQNFERNPKGIPPFNIKWIKGSFRIAASREFVEFAVNNSTALKILDLLKENDAKRRINPDEQYYSTLNYNKRILGTPGGMSVLPEDDRNSKPCLVRLVNWRDHPCQSKKRVRGVCIWGVKDLPFIVGQPHLFLNKIYWDFEPYALSCLSEAIYRRAIRDFHEGQISIDQHYYASYA